MQGAVAVEGDTRLDVGAALSKVASSGLDVVTRPAGGVLKTGASQTVATPAGGAGEVYLMSTPAAAAAQHSFVWYSVRTLLVVGGPVAVLYELMRRRSRVVHARRSLAL